MSLTAIIHTKNSADTVARALASVKFADEVVVVDMESTDDTVAIAKQAKARVTSHPDVGFVEPARNFGISQADSDWILILDADEEIPASLRDQIVKVMAEVSADAYKIPRKNMVFNHWMQHTGWWPDYQIRLFKKGSVVWSEEIHSQPDVKGKLAEFPATENMAILHHNYPTVESYLERLNRYTTITADRHPGKSSDFSAGTFFDTFGDQFFSRFFAHQGIKDGVHGLNVSLLQAMYELVVKLKVWQAKGFPETKESEAEIVADLEKWQAQLEYWLADWHHQHSRGLTRIWWQIRRKLQR